MASRFFFTCALAIASGDNGAEEIASMIQTAGASTTWLAADLNKSAKFMHLQDLQSPPEIVIANEYTVSYTIENKEAGESQVFLEEMEKQEISTQTGLDLDTFFRSMGAPTVTITDGAGNAASEETEGGETDQSNNVIYPLHLSLNFKKASSAELTLMRTNDSLSGLLESRLKSSFDMASEVYNSKTIGNDKDAVLIDGCNFAFRGSNDLGDWRNNILGALSKETVGGFEVHGGFYDELQVLMKLPGDLEGKARACGDNANFIGHSLGGAIATVARLHFGKGKVTTFCAPKVFKRGQGCPILSGDRVFHEEDPVASNLYYVYSTHDHGQTGTKLHHGCKEYRSTCYGWGWARYCYNQCTDWGYKASTTSCTESAKFWSWNFWEFHSLSYYSKFFY